MLRNLISINKSRLEMSGVRFPPGSDRAISVSVAPIETAGEFRRTVNGDLIDISRASLRRRLAIAVTGNDMRPPAFASIFPGSYAEVIAPEPASLSLPLAQTSALLPRAAVDVVGMTASGDLVLPTAQPASPRPLQSARTVARLIALRSATTVTFPSPVVIVRYRPAIPCLAINSSVDARENRSSVSWSLDLEEC